MNLLTDGAFSIDARPVSNGMAATTRFNNDFWTRNDNLAAVAFIIGPPGRVSASRTEGVVHARQARLR